MSNRALVVGAGPAGLSAAIQLAGWCNQVIVVDVGREENMRQVGEHLPPRGLCELSSLGFDALLGDDRHRQSSGVNVVWGDQQSVSKEYYLGIPGSGLNLQRQVLHSQTVWHTREQGITIEFETHVSSLARQKDGSFSVVLKSPVDHHKISARFLIDATGRRAAIARKLGATRRRYDQLVGINGHATLTEPLDDNGRLYIEAMEDGWWYAVQVTTGVIICTYMTDTSVIRHCSGGPEALWRDRLKQSTILGPLVTPDHVAVDIHDAATQILESDSPAGFIAVGDSALAFDPLSSWGIAKGMSDGHAGAQALQMEYQGDDSAVAGHRSRQQEEFRQYLIQRQTYYQAENRWPDSPFWYHRHQSPQSHLNSGG